MLHMLQWLYTGQVCLSGCCICFTYNMLQVSYSDVVYLFNGFKVFLGFFASVFRRMFMFHLSLDICCKCCI
jgi:hypothetical protein